MDVAPGRNSQSFNALYQHSASEGVALGNRRARFTADVIVVLEFESFEPFRIPPDKADQLPG